MATVKFVIFKLFRLTRIFYRPADSEVLSNLWGMEVFTRNRLKKKKKID